MYATRYRLFTYNCEEKLKDLQGATIEARVPYPYPDFFFLVQNYVLNFICEKFLYKYFNFVKRSGTASFEIYKNFKFVEKWLGLYLSVVIQCTAYASGKS